MCRYLEARLSQDAGRGAESGHLDRGRTRKLGIARDWEARATALVDKQVYPALERQIAAFSKATAKATDVAGVHRLPDGAAYYEWALRLGTTTTHSASEIHAIGLEQNKQLQRASTPS
jgi:uncharacterized protein (DUF885 family)